MRLVYADDIPFIAKFLTNRFERSSNFSWMMSIIANKYRGRTLNFTWKNAEIGIKYFKAAPGTGKTTPRLAYWIT